MRKISLVLPFAVLFLLVSFMLTDLRAEESSIENYFPMKLNVGYYYDAVQGPTDVLGRWQYQICIKKERVGGELTGVFHTFWYNIKNIKWETIAVYSIGDKEIFLNYRESSLGGSYQYVSRPIILKIPQKGRKEKWEREDERDSTGKSKAKVVHTSEYVSTLKTALGTFQDVIMVTQLTYLSDKLITTDVKYYTKDLGLIREEIGRGKDKVIIDLVKVENN